MTGASLEYTRGRRSRFRVAGRFDVAGARQLATIIIHRPASDPRTGAPLDGGVFLVRPLRRRRVYRVTLAAVAELVCQSIIRAEVAEKRRARKRKVTR